MNSEMDYYRILGVLPTADDRVIRAAHRVLTQKYRPGRTRANAAEAENRMARIEEAFGILSDPAARAEYDKQRSQLELGTREYSEQEVSEDLFEESGWRSDWELASKFYPELREIETQFRAISAQLAFTYCAFLLETKRFPEATAIAREMELAYLGGFFGEDPDILAFAKQLIVSGNIDAVRMLGNALRVLGSSTPAQVIIDTLVRELPEGDFFDVTSASEIAENPEFELAAEPAEAADEGANVASEQPDTSVETQVQTTASKAPVADAKVVSTPPRSLEDTQKAAPALLKSAPRPAAKETREAGTKSGIKDPKTRAAIQEFLRLYRATGGLDVDSAMVLVQALGGTVDSRKPGTLMGEAGIEVVFRGQRINFGPDDFLQWAERKLLPEALAQR